MPLTVCGKAEAGACVSDNRESHSPHEMLLSSRLERDNGYVGAVVAFLDERDSAVDESEEGMILAHTNVEAWVMNSATLTNDDVASLSSLTAKKLQAKSFAFRVAAVLRTADTFLVCHFFRDFKGLGISR